MLGGDDAAGEPAEEDEVDEEDEASGDFAEVQTIGAQSHDPVYAELLRECSRALSPTPELSRQSSEVIAELERMVAIPLSPAADPADGTYKSAGAFSPRRAADARTSEIAWCGNFRP